MFSSTRLNVITDDGDMFISVRSCVFMPESYHMSQLMNNNPKFITVLSDGYGLRSCPTSAHIRAASRGDQKEYLELQKV